MAQTSNSENITVTESYDLSKVSSVNENLTSLSPSSGRSDDHSINEQESANKELIEENIEMPGDRTTKQFFNLSSEAVNNLSYGLLANFLPDLQKAKSSLDTVSENQRILIECIHNENLRYHESEALVGFAKTMEKAKVYHAKLQAIKRDMLLLHENSSKLKKRAIRLQQQRQKEEWQKEQERERERERENMLIARQAKKQADNTPPRT